MKKYILILTIIGAVMTIGCQSGSKKISYPKAKKVDVVDTYFGQEVADPYRWLEDDNSQETAEWVREENEITQKYLAKIPFRAALKQRFEELWNYPKIGMPFKKGGRYYFYKNDGLQNQSVLYMQKTLDDNPEVFLDPNTFSTDGTIALSSISPSKDGKYFAYAISRDGSDWNEIVVMDIETRTMLADTIKWVKFSGISWYNDGFYYSCYDAPKEGMELSAANQFHKVKYHQLGTPQNSDVLIFDDKANPLRNFVGFMTDDNEYLVISESESTSGNALYVRKATDNKGFTKITDDSFEFEYSVIDHIKDGLLVLTNDNAPCGKLVVINPEKPAKENWRTILIESKNVLQSVQLAGNIIFASYLQDASSKGYFYDYDGNLLEELKLPTLGSISGFSGDKGDPIAFYGFTSFTFPSRVYKLNLDNYHSELYIDSKVDFEPDNFTIEQVFFNSKDGTSVPMFLVYRKDLERNGNNPTLLYGYGGFNISLTPSFNISILPFIEQGGVYAMVNLRGGGEYGEKWHFAGTKMEKQNVFDDFISATEYLIENNYTNNTKTAIMGGSNGGLLVGACMVQRPDLFKVAIPIVGVLDMLRYHNFTIGWAWASDYGRSDDSEEMFRYLYKYSPLHNIKKDVAYPITLAMTADHDDRVVPAHTFKFMAELQEKHAGENPVLVRIETNAGHGSGKPTSKRIEENADMYGFIMYNLGMSPNFEK
ncbi:MAG: prolyl oligopeptidase family serine peptidase [Lentimicrobiaceae bacterium]|jgi:prolyl oligopeptidase|nr:prolyl oligopeptidase family serine peptidase [Lentimicrobiaceae bacterium]